MATKTDIQLQTQMLADNLATMFLPQPDDDCYILIKGSGIAQYDPKTNIVQISIGRVCIDTICHELAHWIHYRLNGDSDCGNGNVLSKAHSEWSLTIREYADSIGYTKWLQNTLR